MPSQKSVRCTHFQKTAMRGIGKNFLYYVTENVVAYVRFCYVANAPFAYANTRTITSTALIECYVLRYAFSPQIKICRGPH